MSSPILIAIEQRRSIREFTDQPVNSATLHEIIRAGVWAPSGLNNQPWRFVIVTDAAIIAVGHPSRRDQQSQRKPLAEFIVKEL